MPLLFHTRTIGPAYCVSPVISRSPVVSIALSFLLLRERTGWQGTLGSVPCASAASVAPRNIEPQKIVFTVITCYC